MRGWCDKSERERGGMRQTVAREVNHPAGDERNACLDSEESSRVGAEMEGPRGFRYLMQN